MIWTHFKSETFFACVVENNMSKSFPIFMCVIITERRYGCNDEWFRIDPTKFCKLVYTIYGMRFRKEPFLFSIFNRFKIIVKTCTAIKRLAQLFI